MPMSKRKPEPLDPGTVAELAAIGFDPLKLPPTPTLAEWLKVAADLYPSVVIAFTILRQTPAELLRTITELGDPEAVLSGLEAARQRHADGAATIAAAHARYIATAARWMRERGETA